ALADELSSESYGTEERKQLEQVLVALREIQYDRNRHMELKRKLSELLPDAELVKEVTLAVSERPKIDERLGSCRAQLKSKRETL
ncbi:hypothetical protein ABTF44_21765, partial [Acinetobacter baumannii]